MRSFSVEINITARRIGNGYSLKSLRVIDVEDDTNIDEIIDVPLGKLILGSAYKSKQKRIPYGRDSEHSRHYRCSFCNFEIADHSENPDRFTYNYCPNCGKRLKEVLGNGAGVETED